MGENNTVRKNTYSLPTRKENKKEKTKEFKCIISNCSLLLKLTVII